MAAPSLERLHTLVGRIALSWNEVDLLWYLILTCLMKETPREQIDAVYHLFQTSAAQRQMIMAIKGTFPEKDKLAERLGQLNAKTNDAAGNRNAAIHALIVEFPNIVVLGTEIKVTGAELRVAPGTHSTKKNRLTGTDVEAALFNTATEIEALIHDLEAIRAELAPAFEIRADILADMILQAPQP